MVALLHKLIVAQRRQFDVVNHGVIFHKQRVCFVYYLVGAVAVVVVVEIAVKFRTVFQVVGVEHAFVLVGHGNVVAVQFQCVAVTEFAVQIHGKLCLEIPLVVGIVLTKHFGQIGRCSLTASRRFRPLGVNHNVACECLGYSPRGRALCVGVPSAKHLVAVLRSCRQLEIAVKRNNYRTCAVLCVKHHVVARCYGRFRPFGVDGDVSRQRLRYSPRCCTLCVGVPSAKHLVAVLRSCRQLETAVEFDSCRRRAVLRIECYGVHRGSACRKHQNQRKNYCQKSRNFSFHVVPPK